jgi:hypothetical protein
LSEDPAISGLVIELSDDDHGHDLTKWRKWISSPAFHYFRYVASKYGFYVVFIWVFSRAQMTRIHKFCMDFFQYRCPTGFSLCPPYSNDPDLDSSGVG